MQRSRFSVWKHDVGSFSIRGGFVYSFPPLPIYHTHTLFLASKLIFMFNFHLSRYYPAKYVHRLVYAWPGKKVHTVSWSFHSQCFYKLNVFVATSFGMAFSPMPF